MLTLLLFFCSIPYTPRITLSDDHVDIVAPSDVCHDVILAVGDVIEPGWRNQPFPVWVDNANKGKETLYGSAIVFFLFHEIFLPCYVAFCKGLL